MSNLGSYQRMTILAKKVGGPVKLAIITASAGFCFFRGIEEGGRRTIKFIKNKLASECEVCDVEFETLIENEIRVKPNDKIRILEEVEDGYLVEIIGRKDNPFIISKEQLEAMTGFEFT